MYERKMMEKVREYFGTIVIGTLFLSMFFSTLTTLAQNVHTLEVTVASCSQLIVDYDELELAVEHEIVPGKNIIETVRLELAYEPIPEAIFQLQKYSPIDLTNDIFYPPKPAAV